MYEGLICICCMTTENLVDLFSTNEETENYARMLKTCFNIRVSQHEGLSHICENCKRHLQDSLHFKNQILTSISILTSVNCKDSMTEDSNDTVKVKEKYVDHEEDRNEENDESSDHGEKTSSHKDEKKCSPEKLPYTRNQERFYCSECSMDFATDVLLKIHYCTHYQAYQCEQCGKGFMTSIAFNNHLSMHKGNQNIMCYLCNKNFPTAHLYRRHIESKHCIVPKDACCCEYCGKKFRFSDTKEKHVQLKHEVVLYSCPLCNYKSKKQYLKSHMANKHQIGEKKHQCSYCKKRFTRGISLRQHVRIHLNDRKYICRICNKNFIHKCSLKGHILTHVRHGDYVGDPQDLLDNAQRTDDEYDNPEDSMTNLEETPCLSTEDMVEEFLLEDEELDAITNSLKEEVKTEVSF